MVNDGNSRFRPSPKSSDAKDCSSTTTNKQRHQSPDRRCSSFVGVCSPLYVSHTRETKPETGGHTHKQSTAVTTKNKAKCGFARQKTGTESNHPIVGPQATPNKGRCGRWVSLLGFGLPAEPSTCPACCYSWMFPSSLQMLMDGWCCQWAIQSRIHGKAKRGRPSRERNTKKSPRREGERESYLQKCSLGPVRVRHAVAEHVHGKVHSGGTVDRDWMETNGTSHAQSCRLMAVVSYVT